MRASLRLTWERRRTGLLMPRPSKSEDEVTIIGHRYPARDDPKIRSQPISTQGTNPYPELDSPGVSYNWHVPSDPCPMGQGSGRSNGREERRQESKEKCADE